MTLIPKDIIINQIGSLLMCKNRTVRPRIGGNISGKYMATVRPMKPMAVMCIHMSCRKNTSEKNTEIIDNIIPIISNVNDSFETKRVYLYVALFSPMLSFIILEVLKPAKTFRAQVKQTTPANKEKRKIASISILSWMKELARPNPNEIVKIVADII